LDLDQPDAWLRSIVEGALTTRKIPAEPPRPTDQVTEVAIEWGRGGVRAAAVARLEQLHGARLRRFLTSVAGQDAEGLANDTFANLCRPERFSVFLASRKSPYAAVNEEARNNIVRQWRRDRERRKREKVIAPEGSSGYDPSSSQTSPSRRVRRRIREEQLHAAIEQLDEQKRTIIHLKNHAALRWDEIARRCGTTIAAAKMQYQRAVKSLEQILADDPEFDPPTDYVDQEGSGDGVKRAEPKAE
jgi:RNA polymerase sigma factor (sigma-70 family)